MTDSVFVLPPGERVTDDSTGEPVSGGTLYFYDAGTTTPKTVYADSDLLVALGTSVVTDALGYPTSDGVTRTLIYVGTARYKIVIKDASGVTIATHDNIPGAVVSASSVNVAVTALFPVVTKSADYTVVSGDQNTTFVGNCSSADVNFTLPSAVTVGSGWKVKIQHAGSANRIIVKVASGSGQTISGGVSSSASQIALVRQGEDIEITSDGGNWRVSSHTPASPKGYTTGVIQIVSRLSTSPGSPKIGDRYILTGTGGAWSTFTTGDIATWNGATWTNQTPPSNCGWRAWVQAENLYYSYISSAWAAETATTSAYGTLKTATAAVQVTGTATDTAVTPSVQQNHKSAVKAWGSFNGNPTLTVKGSYNVSSITRSGTGNYTVNFTTAMANTNYVVVVSSGTGGAGGAAVHNGYCASKNTGSCGLVTSDQNFSLFDDNNIDFVVLGDQ